jgi:uncharacterized RDD family membrane protein YckC
MRIVASAGGARSVVPGSRIAAPTDRRHSSGSAGGAGSRRVVFDLRTRRLVGLDKGRFCASLAAAMSESTSEHTPVSAPAPAETPAPAKAKSGGVKMESLRVDPSLADRRLASWWQRAGAMAVDVALMGALSLLTGPVLGFFTGLTVAALGSRSVSDTRIWGIVRLILWFIGGGVMFASALLITGRPILRTGAFNLDRALVKQAGTSEAFLPPSPSYEQLKAYADQLAADNRRLRESVRGSSWLNAVTDFSRTLGLTFGWAGVYFTLITAWWRGRTVGKFIFGTRVVRLDGRPLTMMDAFTRYGGYAAGLATGMLGFARLLWDPNGRAIEDRVAWTVVLRNR